MSQNIDTIRKTPLVLTGIILEILKSYFQQMGSQFKYQVNELNSKLIIEPSFKWNPEQCQNRPGIFVKREDITFGDPRAGMDDLHTIYPIQKKYATFGRSAWTIYCISKVPGEAEILSEKASDCLIAFAPLIRRDFRFISFGVSKIAPIGKMEESKEFWAVPIRLHSFFSESWDLSEEAVLIRDIYLKVTFSDP